jgi:peptidoglycan hydrolase CwlO-like protein
MKMDTLNVIPLYSEEVQKLIDIKNLEEGIKSLYSDLNFLDQKIKEYKSNPLMLTEVQKMVNVTQSRIETLETKIAEITQEIKVPNNIFIN